MINTVWPFGGIARSLRTTARSACPSWSARDDSARTLDRDQLEANAVPGLGEVMRRRRHDRLIVAVARNRDTQDARAFIIVDCRGDGGDRYQASDDRSEYETAHPVLSA